MKIMKLLALFLCLAISLAFLVACVDDASNQGGGHYKDPSEQGDANSGNDSGGNSENNGEDGSTGDGDNSSDIGGQGNGSTEKEFPLVPIE